MQQDAFPTRPHDQHRLMERLANARVSEERAREIMTSREAHRAFMAEIAMGLGPYAKAARP